MNPMSRTPLLDHADWIPVGVCKTAEYVFAAKNALLYSPASVVEEDRSIDVA